MRIKGYHLRQRHREAGGKRLREEEECAWDTSFRPTQGLPEAKQIPSVLPCPRPACFDLKRYTWSLEPHRSPHSDKVGRHVETSTCPFVCPFPNWSNWQCFGRGTTFGAVGLDPLPRVQAHAAAAECAGRVQQDHHDGRYRGPWDRGDITKHSLGVQ